MTAPQTFTSGSIAIIGAPNVGKSTLINRFVGHKVAAVTDKPQTTRSNILGVLQNAQSEIIFYDTPGYHHSEKPLNQWMLHQMREAWLEADRLLWLIEAPKGIRGLEKEIARELLQQQNKLVIAINKIDLVSKGRLLPIMEMLSQAGFQVPVIPISAQENLGINDLLQVLREGLEESNFIYHKDIYTPHSIREMAAEFIREKVFEETEQEIPYELAVVIEDFREATSERKITEIYAAIVVSKTSHRPIILGKQGARIKVIGQAARKELQKLLGHKVYLKLFVKVIPDWTNKPYRRKELGYA